MSIINVAIAGATGNIGESIVKALLESNQFKITALIRTNSTSRTTLLEGVNAATVDYEDINTLVQALKGQHAVISALSSASAAEQSLLLDASVQAGVQRFIPSEYGSDTSNAHASQLPVFASKKKIERQLESLAAEGKITYTYVYSGPFLDFGLEVGFLGLDLKKRQLTVLDGGNSRFGTTTRDTVGKAVAGILAKPEETRNRAVDIEDIALTMKDLLRLSKEALGAEGWTEIDGGTCRDTEQASYQKLQNGQKDMKVFVGFLLSAIFREGYGGHFAKLDNELFGIPKLTESDIIEVIQKAAKSHIVS